MTPLGPKGQFHKVISYQEKSNDTCHAVKDSPEGRCKEEVNEGTLND